MPILNGTVTTVQFKPARELPDGTSQDGYMNWSIFDRDTMQREYINVYSSALPRDDDGGDYDGRDFVALLIKGSAYINKEGKPQSTLAILPGSRIRFE